MRRSEAFLSTTREDQHRQRAVGLALRADLIRQFGAGLYGFTPTGLRVQRNIEAVIHETWGSH